MTSFCKSYNLISIIKQPTCFKNPEKPSCIDLILTNRPKSFQSTCVIETGLSDFHRMTVSVLNMHFRKLPPKVITYRNFSNYDNANFINSLNDVLNEHENQEHLLNDPDCFYKVCVEVLNQHAPQKKKHVRGKNKPFLNKTLSKAIMQRTKLRNKFLKDPTEHNKTSYTKQRNWCVSLLRKEKNEYFANLNEKDIIDNKNFWQTVKPFLSEKLKSREKITLVENEELVSSEFDIAQRFNQFFSNIVKNLDIPKYVVGDTLHLNLKNHPTLMAILKYRDHPSIITIKRFRYPTVPFHFSYIDKKTVLKIIRSLSKNKASQETDMPVRVVKENAEYFAEIICSQFNESINSSKCPLSFKLANITPVFKNESRNHKNNHRPVSILPLISKVFEKIMNKQLSIYFEGILSKFQCGFRKGFIPNIVSF